MGQRSKVDLQGLLERVLALYKEGKTLVEMEHILRKDGYDVSRESIRRSIKSSKEIAEKYKLAQEETRILIETVRQDTNTDVLETINSLLASKIFEYTKSIEDMDFENTQEFINSVGKLTTSQVKMAKLRLSFQNGVDKAKATILAEMKKVLQDHPDVLSKIAEIVHKVHVAEK